jgi:two-component system response regulator FixJ
MNTPVIILDKDKLCAERVSDMLRAFGVDFYCYDDPQRYLQSEHFRQRHILLIDMALPEINSLDLMRLVAERSAAAVIFAIAAHPTIAEAVQSIKAGAHDYLAKPISIAPIMEILRNPWGPQLDLTGISDIFLQLLTGRELEVVAGLLEGGSSKQIARVLGISHRTVEVHRRHIFKKLKVTSTAELILRNRADGRASTLNA